MEMRKEDKSQTITDGYDRTDRIFQNQDGWFFTVRQGAAFGPYESRQHAEKHLDSFVSLLQ